MIRQFDLFDFAIPNSADPIASGLRMTDMEEVRLVVASELEKAKGRPNLKWNIYKRSDGVATIVFETTSKRDCDAFRTAIGGFMSRFGVNNKYRYTNDYKVFNGCVQWWYRLELDFGKFKE